jgi:hypothetical protein
MTWEGKMRHAYKYLSGVLGLGGVVAGALVAPSAMAQESYFQTPVPPPSRAFELQMSGGYTQGFGNVFPNHSILDVAGAGLGLTAAIGYRATPVVSFDLEGQYQAFSSQNAGTAQGLDANIGVTVHARPSHRGDPWLRLGTGYRWVWVNSAPVGRFGDEIGNIGFSGFDIVNARIGYDIRPSAGVAWAPVLGANLQTFIWANSTSLSTVQWGTFVYAGLQARFDAGGNRGGYARATNGHETE